MKFNIKRIYLIVGLVHILSFSDLVSSQGIGTDKPEEAGESNQEEDYSDVVKCKYCRKDINVCSVTNCRKLAHPKPESSPPSQKHQRLTVASSTIDMAASSLQNQFFTKTHTSLEDMLKPDSLPGHYLSSTVPDGATPYSGNFFFPAAETNPIYITMAFQLQLMAEALDSTNILIVLKNLHQLQINTLPSWHSQVLEQLSNFVPIWQSMDNLMGNTNFENGYYVLRVQHRGTGRWYSALIVITAERFLVFVLKDNLHVQVMIGLVEQLKIGLICCNRRPPVSLDRVIIR